MTILYYRNSHKLLHSQLLLLCSIFLQKFKNSVEASLKIVISRRLVLFHYSLLFLLKRATVKYINSSRDAHISLLYG